MKKFFKKINNKNGVTLVELVIAMSLIIIFLLTSTLLISSSTATYKKNAEMNYAKSIIDNISNDIKNYITYGENIRLFDYDKNATPIENYKDIKDNVSGSLNEFNGINLGFLKIYVEENDKGKNYIKGLSYTPEYYKGFKPKIKIKKTYKDLNNNGKWDINEPIIYLVNISLEKKDMYSSFDFEVEQLNESEFGYLENPKK